MYKSLYRVDYTHNRIIRPSERQLRLGGELVMYRSDLSKLITENASRIAHFFVTDRFTAKKSGQIPASDSATDSHSPQAFSGGYNEAYIMQYWASYTLK